MEAVQNEIFGFGGKPQYTPQQKSTVELLTARGFTVEGTIKKDNRTVVRLSRPYGRGSHGGPRYAYVYTDGTINEKIPVEQYLRIVGESMSKPQDPRFRAGREEAPMGAVNVEEGWAQGEYTPQQQRAIDILQRLGFEEVGSFPNQPDAESEPAEGDNKVTVVLQKTTGPMHTSVEVDADGSCNGQPLQDYLRANRTNEMIGTDGRYDDDMESGVAVKKLHNLNEKDVEEQSSSGDAGGFATPFAFKKKKVSEMTSTGDAAGYATPFFGGSGKRAMDVTKRMGYKQVEKRPKRTE
jgi:hypothetical protein